MRVVIGEFMSLDGVVQAPGGHKRPLNRPGIRGGSIPWK